VRAQKPGRSGHAHGHVSPLVVFGRARAALRPTELAFPLSPPHKRGSRADSLESSLHAGAPAPAIAPRGGLAARCVLRPGDRLPVRRVARGVLLENAPYTFGERRPGRPERGAAAGAALEPLLDRARLEAGAAPGTLEVLHPVVRVVLQKPGGSVTKGGNDGRRCRCRPVQRVL
jgi:hypothetical protein